MAESPGIFVYDNFETARSFGATITAEIDPVQYWRDRPLFLKYIKPTFNDAVAWNNKEYTEYIDNPELLSYIDSAQNIVLGIDAYEVEAQRITDQIEKYSRITSSDTDPIDYPNITPDQTTFDIKDADGNIIETINTDVNARETKDVAGSNPAPITILDFFPDNYNDDTQNTAGDTPTIVTLPDSYIRDKLWITKDKIPALNIELDQAYSLVIDPITDMTDLIQQPDLDDPTDYINSISSKQEVWYGIPLINLSPRGTPLSESVIVHVNTAKFFTLDVTNVIGTGFEKLSINIDRTIPSKTRFTAGVFFAETRLTLYLKIDGDPEVYTSSITMANSPELTLTSFGSDNDGTKSLCGTIWDIRYLEKSNSFNSDPSTPIPIVPDPDEFFWDNNNDRIRGDSTFPIGVGRKPAYTVGSFLELDSQWRAVFNGYIDRFFCRDNLKNTSFTVSWFQYLLRYPSGVVTLLADNLNSNYIRYDWRTHEVIIEFNGVVYREILVLPEQLWMQVSIRFDKELNLIKVRFKDTYWDREESIELYIGEGLIFELMSIMGRFDRAEARYLEIYNSAYTLIHIASKYKSNDELNVLYENHKKFLIKYDLKLIPHSNLP